MNFWGSVIGEIWGLAGFLRNASIVPMFKDIVPLLVAVFSHFSRKSSIFQPHTLLGKVRSLPQFGGINRHTSKRTFYTKNKSLMRWWGELPALDLLFVRKMMRRVQSCLRWIQSAKKNLVRTAQVWNFSCETFLYSCSAQFWCFQAGSVNKHLRKVMAGLDFFFSNCLSLFCKCRYLQANPWFDCCKKVSWDTRRFVVLSFSQRSIIHAC